MRAYDLAGIDAYPCACARAARLAGRCACRDASTLVVADPERYAWRLRSPRHPVAWVDRARGPQLHVPDDDPVLVRAGGEAGYPLAVVVDDARDGVTEVVRGADLVEATAAQVVLHAMLGLPRPTYLHVPLLLGPDGRKLGKSHGSTDLRALRAAGWMPEDVWRRLLPLLGLVGPKTLAEAVGAFDAARVQPGPLGLGDDGSVAG
jgi:glutamyl/glutaminyl-tRNA synthetase